MSERHGTDEYDALLAELDSKFSEFSGLETRMEQIREEIVRLKTTISQLHDTLPLEVEVQFQRKYGPILETTGRSPGQRNNQKMALIAERVRPKIEACGICGLPLPLFLVDDVRLHTWVIRGEKVCESCFMSEITGGMDQGEKRGATEEDGED